MRRSHIGIIGPNADLCSKDLYAFGRELGARIAATHRLFICGGLGGFMEAVCYGVKQWPGSFFGQTIGLLPGTDKQQANPYIDLPIATGLGEVRNIILVRTVDILIAAGGGAGTLSELAFACQQEKKVLCVTLFGGWAATLANAGVDIRCQHCLVPVQSIEQIEELLRSLGA